MLDDSDNVMGVIGEWIEARYEMPVADLRRQVAVDPRADAEATSVVQWYGRLAEAQAALERAEDVLVEALGSQSGIGDPVMALAHQVNAAIAARDGRATVVIVLLDAEAPGKRGPGAWPGVSSVARRPQASTTMPPVAPPTGAVPVRGAAR